MRQFRILYKRGVGGNFKVLEKHTFATLYNRRELRVGVGVMRDFPYIEAVAVRLDDELFNVVSFDQDAEAPNAFTFGEFLNSGDELTINAPVDENAVLAEALETVQ